MLKEGTEKILNTYCGKNAAIASIRGPLRQCIVLLCDCFERGGQLLVCGNGGSCADADHIVGELVKAFKLNRPLTEPLAGALQEQGSNGALLAEHLQSGLPAINLAAHSALLTAVVNDMGESTSMPSKRWPMEGRGMSFWASAPLATQRMSSMRAWWPRPKECGLLVLPERTAAR